MNVATHLSGAWALAVFHGFGGRLAVADIEHISPVTKILSKAFSDLGIKKRDVNGRTQYGTCRTQEHSHHQAEQKSSCNCCSHVEIARFIFLSTLGRDRITNLHTQYVCPSSILSESTDDILIS